MDQKIKLYDDILKNEKLFKNIIQNNQRKSFIEEEIKKLQNDIYNDYFNKFSKNEITLKIYSQMLEICFRNKYYHVDGNIKFSDNVLLTDVFSVHYSVSKIFNADPVRLDYFLKDINLFKQCIENPKDNNFIQKIKEILSIFEELNVINKHFKKENYFITAFDNKEVIKKLELVLIPQQNLYKIKKNNLNNFIKNNFEYINNDLNGEDYYLEYKTYIIENQGLVFFSEKINVYDFEGSDTSYFIEGDNVTEEYFIEHINK